MKLIKKVTAGFLLTLGGICLIAGAYAPFDYQVKPEERFSTAMAGLIFGLPLTGVGGWIAWGLYQQAQKEKRDRLQSIFYHLLKKGNGHITILQLAMEAKLTGTEAKHYLDEQAREFNADFNVSDEGDVFYHFNIGGLDALHLAAAPIPIEKKKKRKRKRSGK